MKEPKPKKQGKAAALIMRDVLLVGAVLVIFSLFHHVLPRGGGALLQIVGVPQATPNAVSSGQKAEAQATARPAKQATPASTPALTHAPSAAPGDFSASFPKEDTGTGADYSYQSDSLRIAINKVQKNGVTYFVSDLWVRDITTFQTAFAGGQYGAGKRESPVQMATEVNAVFAVSGDYYAARASGIVIRNGVLYRDEPYEDVCLLYINGEIETVGKKEFSLASAIEKQAWQAWSFGPMLLSEGQPATKFPAGIRDKNPRCAIGYYEPGHYCLVVVDGRQDGYSSGMTLMELSELFYELGCKTAYNLDGGETAQMVFLGKLVNHPSGKGRKSSDILCFGEENK